MNCQRCRIEIEELGTSERLSEGARAHLSLCAMCRAFHDERQSLKRLIGGLGAVSAPPDFDFRLRARLAAAKEAGNGHSSWRSFLSSAQAVGLAAAFALLVAGIVFYNQTKSKSTVTEQPGLAAIESPERNTSQASSGPAQTTTVTADVPQAPGAIVKDSVGSIEVAHNPRSSKSINRNGARRESVRPAANDAPAGSNDMASRAAEQIVPGSAAPFTAGVNVNGIVELPVRSASQPMRVFVDDKSGTKRALTLEPVVFGSQDLMGRNTPRPASSQGIW